VFLGTVTLADPDGDANQLIFRNQLDHVRVDAAFKGVFAGQTIELHEGASDCDAKFKTDQRAVFYLYAGTRDRWSVLWCAYAAIASVVILIYFWRSQKSGPFPYAQPLWKAI
jgi:hypothetical protein